MYNLLLGLWLWFAMINTRSITIGKKYFFRTKKRAQPGLENGMTWIRKGRKRKRDHIKRKRTKPVATSVRRAVATTTTGRIIFKSRNH